MSRIPQIEDILSITTEKEFDDAALEIFRFQAENCEPYNQYLSLTGCDIGKVSVPGQIPCLPIELFKTHKIYCAPGEYEAVFTSSTTGGSTPSKHYIASLADYRKVTRKAFSIFYGEPSGYRFYALLPGYLEREGSSLILMMKDLIDEGGGGFYLNEHEKLLSDIRSYKGKKYLLGVSYALLDLAEGYSPTLEGMIVAETGGMKGTREEIPKDEFHAVLCERLNVPAIHSEYGMAELMSQAYSFGQGIFSAPPWMKITIRDLNDPFTLLAPENTGGVNIIDLANIYSCSFIQTQDMGVIDNSGNFRILGRIDSSETRGCNLLVQ